jgi:hypothetical protein
VSSHWPVGTTSAPRAMTWPLVALAGPFFLGHFSYAYWARAGHTHWLTHDRPISPPGEAHTGKRSRRRRLVAERATQLTDAAVATPEAIACVEISGESTAVECSNRRIALFIRSLRRPPRPRRVESTHRRSSIPCLAAAR